MCKNLLNVKIIIYFYDKLLTGRVKRFAVGKVIMLK